MKSIRISETDRGQSHIKRQPEIHNGKIARQKTFGYKNISENIYKKGWNAEINKERYFVAKKKGELCA